MSIEEEPQLKPDRVGFLEEVGEILRTGEVLPATHAKEIQPFFGLSLNADQIVVDHTRRAIKLRKEFFALTGLRLTGTLYKHHMLLHARGLAPDDPEMKAAREEIDRSLQARAAKRAHTLEAKEVRSLEG